MATQQEVIDQLIDYIDKAILKNSVSNRHVAAVLAFLNEKLKEGVDIESLKKLFLGKYGPDRTNFLLELFGGVEVQGGMTSDSILVKSSLTSRQLKSMISDAIIEEGDPNVLGLDLIEEGDGNPDELSLALMEEAASGVGASTLGALDNMDPLFDTLKNALYGLRMDNGTFHPEVLNSSNLKLFVEVNINSGKIDIDFAKFPYASVTLSGDNKILNLSILNTSEGSAGQILVLQTGYKQLSVASNIKGTVDLPLTANTIALLTYNRLGDTIYVHSNTVLGDVQFPTPQRITDLILVYSDSSVCSVQWSAPWANNIYDQATEYDMRYSNSLVDANDAKTWAGLKKVPGIPEPAVPGELQKMTISGLTANKEYYVYLKSIKANFGVEYTSAASDFVYFRTLGKDDISVPYRSVLDIKNITAKNRDYMKDTEGNLCKIDYLIDEHNVNRYLDSGYPDLTEKGYKTYWQTSQYSFASCPYHIIIDLYSRHDLDKLFAFTPRGTSFTVYGMKDLGYGWKRLGDCKSSYNAWVSIDLLKSSCRFLKLAFDKMYFGFNDTDVPEGSEVWPERMSNSEMGVIGNLLLYARPQGGLSNIMPPVRRSTVRKTVDQFFCTNGHGYQQGRIHSMCSGEKMRMYIHFGHFAALYGTSDAYTRLADMRFKVNEIPWVSGNNGTGDYFGDHLQNTYRKYGLKPYLNNAGTFDYCYYDKTKYQHNRHLDAYWLPGAWRAAPVKGYNGWDKYFAVTMDGQSYKTISKLCYALSLRYGNAAGEGQGMFYPLSETESTGLDLISGIEPENEPDATWVGWIGYEQPEEYAALMSAVYDGHYDKIMDEDGNKSRYGIKKAGSTLCIASGTASVNVGYLQPMYLWAKTHRVNGSFPADALSVHMYFSNIGNQGNDTSVASQYGITFEEAMQNPVGAELKKMCEYRDRFIPDKEIWLTEFGWGESGGRNTQSKYQCYTQHGRMIGNWTIPDRHRSDVKGAWIVRACIQMMAMGVDMVNYYSTECESNYYDGGQWGSGAGDEMHQWNKCKDETPGTKAAAIKPFEHSYTRGGFATTGLFGQILSNGAYPITRAYWWIATLRTRLKGYVFTGMKYIGSDERVIVACFKKQGEEKGAYVVYLNDNQNTGTPGVEISVPTGVTRVKHVSVYVPEITNPKDVPGALGYDQKRTGLPTSRYERYEGGSWILKNRPYMPGKYSSYTSALAIYPENPQEGDEITVLPTPEENPYFPIVGPVNAKNLAHGNNLSAGQYEQDREECETEPNTDENGNVIWTVKGNNALSWRQVDAICDYIEYHPEGIHGRNGDESDIEVLRDSILVNVSEFPEFYFFDSVPVPDYKSEITDLSSAAISSSAIELYWNNTNIEDTGYQIFVSTLPETGYTLFKEISIGIENKALISGLSPDTTYYYKMRPVKGLQAGTMSNYTGVKTYSKIDAPDNLRVESRTATSITLAWAYTSDQVPDFVYYAIFRADESGAFSQVGKIEDKNILRYMDSGLAIGRTYKYKLRAVGLNGQSEYTPELETRTLLAEECSPTIQRAMTDKLGSKVILVFDLPIGIVSASSKNGFTLTEDGNLRLIQFVTRDEANYNQLILTVPQDSLKDYDKKSDIRINYVNDGSIQSEYGVALDGFTDIKVTNIIGNFSNIEAVYQLNLCLDTTLPVAEWNNFPYPGDQSGKMRNLVDTYGRTSYIGISVPFSKGGNPQFMWGGQNEGGKSINEIPDEVGKSRWMTNMFSTLTETALGRIVLTSLNQEYSYAVRVFGSSSGNDKPLKLKIDGVYSNQIAVVNNLTDTIYVENLSPKNGEITIDFVTVTDDANKGKSCVNYLILEEYKSNDAPENTDVWLRNAAITEAIDNVVKFQDVTVHLNCIGTATAYRLSENQNIGEVAWTDIVADNMDVPYVLSDGFGQKIIYAQVKNSYSESNIRTINVEYRDPYVPLVLRNAFINNDDGRTYDRSVRVMLDKEGIPSRYKVSESSDLSAIAWQVWPDPKLSEFAFTLSQGAGQKTVYVQVMDAKAVSSVKADTINYVPIEKRNIELTLTLPAGMDVNDINASFPVLKYNKKFIFTYTADDGPVGAYGKVLQAVNKKWVDNEKFFHFGQSKTTGYTPDRTLGYTDGCGTEHRLPIGVAIWPNCGNANNPNFMDGEPTMPTTYPYLTWKSVPPILDFGGELYFHNMNQDKWNKDDPAEIVKGLQEDQSRTIDRVGHGVKVMMEPDGNHAYLTAGVMYDAIIMMWAQTQPAVDLYPCSDPEYYKATGMRKVYLDNNANEMAWIKGIHDSENPKWCHVFTHTPVQNIIDLLTELNNTYGKDGNDSVWMATVDEVYEYGFVRKNTTIRKEIYGRTVKFILSVPVDQYFYHKDLCLNINGVTSLNGVTVNANDEALGLTYAMKGESLLLNVNYDEQTTVRAEKYTSLFENTEKPEDKDDAMYFLSLLRPEFAQSYLERINAISASPVVHTFAVNGNDASTLSNAVTCAWAFTGKATHYILSQDAGFAGAEWVEINETTVLPAPFSLAKVEGSHTVYCKIKNRFGESATISDSITYSPPAFALRAIVLHEGIDTVIDRTIAVKFDVVGLDVPTHYMLSEDAGFAGAGWIAYNDLVWFTLSENAGEKTVYAKIKTATKESSVVSDTVELRVVDRKCIVSLNGDYVKNNIGASIQVGYEVYNDETVNIIRDSYDSLQLKDSAGESFGYYKLLASRNVVIEQPVEGVGVYPFKYIATAFGYTNYAQPNPIIPFNLGFVVPTGTYKIRILGNTSHSSGDNLANLFYDANGITVNPTHSIRNNYTEFTEIDNVVVVDGNINGFGELILKYWSNPTRNNKVAVNLIEIIKKG